MDVRIVCLIIGIFLILSGTMIIYATHNEIELTPNEKIELAVKSTQLSSYGWRSEQDKFNGLFVLQGYVNNVLETKPIN